MSLDLTELLNTIRDIADIERSPRGDEGDLAVRTSLQARVDQLIEEGATNPQAQDKEEQRNRTVAGQVQQLIEREAKLNEREKELFTGFLAKEYFTNKDLHELDEFYQHSWHKLSEKGKDAMSERFWEGVRRGDIVLEQAPESVRETEFERVKEKPRETGKDGNNSMHQENLSALNGFLPMNDLNALPQKGTEPFNGRN